MSYNRFADKSLAGLLGAAIGVIVIAFLFLCFEAWLLGLILSWFAVQLTFWQCFAIIFLVQTVLSAAKSSKWSSVTVGGLDTKPANCSQNLYLSHVERWIKCESTSVALQLLGRITPLIWTKHTTSHTIWAKNTSVMLTSGITLLALFIQLSPHTNEHSKLAT